MKGSRSLSFPVYRCRVQWIQNWPEGGSRYCLHLCHYCNSEIMELKDYQNSVDKYFVFLLLL